MQVDEISYHIHFTLNFIIQLLNFNISSMFMRKTLIKFIKTIYLIRTTLCFQLY
jgi:hypothetical protein